MGQEYDWCFVVVLTCVSTSSVEWLTRAKLAASLLRLPVSLITYSAELLDVYQKLVGYLINSLVHGTFAKPLRWILEYADTGVRDFVGQHVLVSQPMDTLPDPCVICVGSQSRYRDDSIKGW